MSEAMVASARRSLRVLIRDAAEYVRTQKDNPEMERLLSSDKPLVTFEEEHANRPPRFVAIVEDYANGVLLSDICAKYGCSRTTVVQYRKLAGVPTRPKRSLGLDDQIEAAYRAGQSVRDIATALGCSEALVSRTATKLGINRYAKPGHAKRQRRKVAPHTAEAAE